MSEDTRTILKKLMRDALDEKDRQRLLCDPKVEERMRSQWDEAADRVNPVVGNRMWERIIARTMATNGVRKLWVYKITATFRCRKRSLLVSYERRSIYICNGLRCPLHRAGFLIGRHDRENGAE